MQLPDAIQLLQPAATQLKNTHRWADLGCGDGLFTKALAYLIDPGSTIYCVDRNSSPLSNIPSRYNEQIIKIIRTDFVKEPLVFDDLDGILMANSLHYVKDKKAFFQKLNIHLQKIHCLLIVEYDTTVANKWVPYPIDYQSLAEMFISKRNYGITKLNEYASIYNGGRMYAALINTL